MVLGPRLRAYRHGPALATIVRTFASRFPELDALDFEVDLLPPSSWWLGLADLDRSVPRIRLRPARPTNPSLTYVIPHELTHLLQRPLQLAPQGERAADLFAMARAGDRFLVAPQYVRVPRAASRSWPSWASAARDLASDAVRARSAGERRYILWWERAFRACVAASVEGPSDGGAPRGSGAVTSPFVNPADVRQTTFK